MTELEICLWPKKALHQTLRFGSVMPKKNAAPLLLLLLLTTTTATTATQKGAALVAGTSTPECEMRDTNLVLLVTHYVPTTSRLYKSIHYITHTDRFGRGKVIVVAMR